MDSDREKWPKDVIPKIKTLKVYQVEEGNFLLQAENFFAIQTRESVILPFLGKPDSARPLPFRLCRYGCHQIRLQRSESD